MEWIAALAFLLCLVYLPKFRKVMMWIGIVGGGLGAIVLGGWKIKDHYDQKRIAEEARQEQEKERDRIPKKAARAEGLSYEELTRAGAVPAPAGTANELERAREKAAHGEPLTDLDVALLGGGKVVLPDGFIPDPVQPSAGSARPKPFDPDKWLREHAERRKPQPNKDRPGEWQVVPDEKSP